jgi:hypothetical protein
MIGALMAAALPGFGCAADASAPGMAVRDSAAIRIVEYADAPMAARTVSLDPEPVYRHGHGPGDHLFARISVGALLPDGRAAVVDAGSGPGGAQEVLLFGPEGGRPVTLARGGQGPMEVRQVIGLTVIAPDTLLVEDRGNAKWLLFSDTTLVRSVSTQGNEALSRLRVLDADGSGALLMTTSSFRTDFTVPWLPGMLVRLDPGSLVPDTVGEYDMAEMRQRDQPWSPFSSAFGDVAGSGGEFVHARSDVAQLVWHGAEGAVRQILRWAAEQPYPSEADKQLFLDSYAEDMARVNPGAPAERLAEMVTRQRDNLAAAIDRPLPLFRDIQGDGQGGVWLGEFTPVAGPFSFVPRYHVVASDGAWVGAAEMPARFRVLDVDGENGRVLGVLVDELGVESVAVFRVTTR